MGQGHSDVGCGKRRVTGRASERPGGELLLSLDFSYLVMSKLSKMMAGKREGGQEAKTKGKTERREESTESDRSQPFSKNQEMWRSSSRFSACCVRRAPLSLLNYTADSSQSHAPGATRQVTIEIFPFASLIERGTGSFSLSKQLGFRHLVHAACKLPHQVELCGL